MLRTALRTAFVFAFASLSLAACGSSGNGNNNNNTPQDMAMAPLPPDMTFDPGPYPEGPYGTKVGDTLYNIKGQGFRLTRENTDANNAKLEELSIDDVIRHNPACKCLLLSQSAIWCGPCRQEQVALVPFIEEHPEFCAYNVLLEDAPGEAAVAPDDLLKWNEFGQNFPIVVANISTKLRLPDTKSIPRNTLINPATMEILALDYGSREPAEYLMMCQMQ